MANFSTNKFWKIWNPFDSSGLFSVMQKVEGGCTDKKENQIFLIYKEIQSGAVAKSYMRKGFLIYEDMR